MFVFTRRLIALFKSMCLLLTFSAALMKKLLKALAISSAAVIGPVSVLTSVTES
jgi:cytochrome c oxidase assembly factor CtaG